MTTNPKDTPATSSKRTLTLNLPQREMDYLNEVSARKDVSKTAILRQALAVYQLYNKGVLTDNRPEIPKILIGIGDIL